MIYVERRLMAESRALYVPMRAELVMACIAEELQALRFQPLEARICEIQMGHTSIPDLGSGVGC